MKKTLVFSALLTLICTQSQAEEAGQGSTAASAPVEQAAPSAPPVANDSIPQALPESTPQASAPAIIDCDYKIDAQTKNIDKSLIQSWSEKAVLQAFTFSPASIDDQMKKLQSCFTDQGWTGFSTALQKSGNIEAIKAQKLTVSSQVDGQIQMGESKENQWKLTLPLQVVYQNDKEKVTQLLNINLTVGRKLSGDLGITQMIAIPRPTQGAAEAKEPEKPQQSTPSEPSAAKPTEAPTAPAANTHSAEQPSTQAPAPTSGH